LEFEEFGLMQQPRKWLWGLLHGVIVLFGALLFLCITDYLRPALRLSGFNEGGLLLCNDT